MRAIEIETQSSSQASLQEKKKRKRRKLLLLLLLLLLFLGLTFTSVVRFFWSSPDETVSTDPRTPAQVEVIETGDDRETKNAIASLQSMVTSLQNSVQELENESHIHSPDDDIPPQNINYDAYQNLQQNNHLNTSASTSILTRGTITNEFLLKTTRLVDISDVNEDGLENDDVLKWDEDANEWVAAEDEDDDTTYEAGSGLTLNDEVFSLGGALDADTTLDLGGFAFTFTNGDVTVDDSLYATAIYQNGNVVCDMSGNCGGGGVFTLTLAGDSGVNQTINNNDTITIAGGSGLTSVGSATDTVTLNIGAGSGITVNANDVAVNQAFAFAWTGAQSWSNSADFNGDVSFADTDIVLDGASTNFTTTGDFSINSDDFFVQQSDGNVGIGNTAPGYTLDVTGSISTSDDLYISGIGLSDTASNTTSGAFVIGVFDEFVNSSSTTVQEVLADLDAAISGSSHAPVTLAGPYDYLTLSGQEITLGQIDLTTDVTGILPLANGGTNADLSAVSTGGIIYKGATALAGSGSLTGVLKGNGSSAPTAMTGTQHFVTRWIDANTLGTGVLYDNATNVGISTTTPGAKLDVVSGSIRADGDLIAGDLYLGYDDTSATITTSDTDEALTIDPNGTGSIFLHGSTYYIDSSGLIYASGLATTGYTPTAGELRADVFRDGDSAYYVQPADVAISGVFAGNIGIGTTSPDFALQVNGVIAPEAADQDLGTSTLRWDLFANTINADSTVTLTGLGTGTDNTVLILNGSNQVTTDEIDPRVWGTSLLDGAGTAGYVAYWSDTDTLAAEQYLSTVRGGLGNDVTAAGAGEVLYSTGASSYESLPAGTPGYVLVSTGASAPTWIDSGALGASYWQKVAGVLSPALAEPIAATSAATTVATFTADGSNVALQAGGTSAFARFNNAGNLLFTNGSGSTIDSTAGLTIGGTTQTGLILGRTGVSTRVANLTTDGVVFTSGGNGTLNSEAQLAIARGGTNSTATPTAGAVSYGTGTAYAFSSAGTIGQALLSGGTGSPTWGTLGLEFGGTNADLSAAATGGLIYKAASSLAATGALTGVLKGNGAAAPTAMTGTTNYVTKWTDANTLGIGVLYDDGTNIGVGTTSPDFALQVNGTIAPETTDQDLGTASLRWDIFANTLNADSTVTFSGLAGGTDNTVLILNGSNQVETREIDPAVWSGSVVAGAGVADYVTYWLDSDTLTSEQYLSTIRGGLGNNVTAAGAGEILYSTGTTAYDSLAAGTLGYVLSSGGAGAPSWVDPATLGTNFWQYANGALSPRTPYTNNTDLLVGSDATASAKFAVLNIFPGSGTPSASVSSGLSGTSMYMTADGTLATSRRGTLTIGNSSTYNTTGDTLINSNGVGNVGIGTTAATAKLEIVSNSNSTPLIIKAHSTQDGNNPLISFRTSVGGGLLGIHSDNIENAYFGYAAGAANTVTGVGTEGWFNTFIGSTSGTSNTTGQRNTALGSNSLLSNTIGDENVAIGYRSMLSNDSGTNNIALGNFALSANSGGSNNVVIGNLAGGNSGNISNNTILGYSAGSGLQDGGSNNTLLGYFVADNLTTGTGNIVLGYNIDAPAATSNNTLTIGNLLYGTGLDGANTTISTGNIGIGTSSPGQKLDVAGNIELANFIYFGNAATEFLNWDGSNFLLSDDFLPAANDVSDLGSDTARWKDLYLGGETLHIGVSTTDEGTISYTSGNILSFGTDTTTNGDIAFFTDDLYLDKSAGNVGINTTTPAQALHVVGNVRISGLSASLPVKTNASNDLISGAINLASAEVTGLLPLTNGGTNADLSGASTGSLIYKGASALQASGSLTGVLKGNGSSAPTAMTGTTNFVTRWTDANTLGTGVLYDNGTNVGISTTTPTSFKLEVLGSIGPTGNNAFNLGSDTRRWANVYATNFFQDGNAVCDVTGNCASVGNLWQYLNGAISPSTPYTNNADLLIGSNATASAKFAVLNIFPGSGTPTASVSTGVSGNSIYLAADGTLATQNRRTLTIGNSSTHNTTGNVVINSNGTGNVGIGTTTPISTLEIDAASPELRFRRTDNAESHSIVFQNSGSSSGLRLYTTGVSSPDFRIAIGAPATDATTLPDVLTILNGGNVGIGSISPIAQLEVQEDVNSDTTILVDNQTAGTAARALLAANTDGSSTQLIGYSASYTTAGAQQASGSFLYASGTGGLSIAGANATSGEIRFYTDGIADANEQMVIQNDGNVGIGTTAPLGGLDVNGANGAASWTYIRGNAGSASNPSASAHGIMMAWNPSGGVGESQILYGTNAGSDPRLDFGSWSGTVKSIAMTLNDGNLGIGTTTPDFPLQVNGVIAPETTDQDLGTTALRWDLLANTINADSTVTLTGLGTGTDDTVLILNASNQVTTDEIDSRVWGTSLIDGAGNTNRVAYWSDANTLTNDADFNFDGTNVGIGTTSTSVARLHSNVGNGGTAAIAGYIYGSTNTGTFSDMIGLTRSAATLVVGSNWSTNSGSVLNVYTNLEDGALFVSGNANVGVGTTAPGARLHVSATGELARLDDTSATGSPFMSFHQAGTRRSYIQHNDTSDTLRVASEYGALSLLAAATAGTDSETEYMRIIAGGNVGVSNASPTSELHIGGTTPELRIGDDGAEDTSLAFMGNATDYYIGLDDSNDLLTIGSGTAVGTSSVIGANANVVSIGPRLVIGSVTNALPSDAYIDMSGSITAIAGGGNNSGVDLRSGIAGSIASPQTNHNGLNVIPFSNLTGTSATVTTYNGIRVAPNIVAGTVTNLRGIYIAAPTGAGTITNRYALVTDATAGNVGIGTTTPISPLEVSFANASTTITGVAAARITNTNTTLNNQSNMLFDLTRVIAAVSTQFTGAAIGAKGTSATDDTTDLLFYTHNGTALTEQMRILANGNVGIGDASPSYSLDIAGTSRATSKQTAKDTGTFGEVSLVTGSATLTGYIEWRNPVADGGTGTRRGYMGWSSTDVVLTLENSSDFQIAGGNVDAQTTAITGGYWLDGKAAMTGESADNWLRLNQSQSWTNGVYTPGTLRVDGPLVLDGIVYFSYAGSTNFVNFNSGHTTSSAMNFYDSDGTRHGAVYGDNNNAQFGLLDGDANWAIRSVRDTSIDFLVNNSQKMTILDGGGVGIGTTACANGLCVDSGAVVVNGGSISTTHGGTLDSSTCGSGCYVLNARNFTGTTTSNGINVVAGSATSGTLMSFSSSTPSVQGTITFASGTVSYNAFTGGHYFHFSSGSNTEEYPYGTLICIDESATNPNSSHQAEYAASICNTPYQTSVAGVYSQRLTEGENDHLMSAVGDGHVLVTNENGPVKRGDPLVSSSTPGYAMKATKAGTIIATATEDWSGQSGSGIVSVYYYPGVFYPGPNTAFSSEGELLIANSGQNYTVTPVEGSPLSNIVGASQAVVGKITTGLINTKELVVTKTATIADLSVTNLTISGQNFNDYIRSIVQLELQNQPNALPEDAIAQDFNSGMVIHNYNTTVTVVQSPGSSSSATFTSSSSGALAITPEINVTEVTQVMPDPRFDILASLISWSDAAIDGVRTLFFDAPTVFRYLAWFQGPVKVNADTSGTITIPEDTLKARVSFSTPFPEKPAVYVSFADGVTIAHSITDVNETGFTINFANAPATDLTIQWLALLKEETETGPTLEVMETEDNDEPATVPTTTPTPTPEPDNDPTPPPATDSGSPEDASPSATGFSGLVEDQDPPASEPADTPEPDEEASSSANTP